MPKSPIRVLLVDDSPVALAVMSRLLAASPEMEVVGTARNGKEALDLIPVVQPTVVCTDLEMPVMNGLELTERVMAAFPTPILVVSAHVQKEDVNIFRALDAGAIDVLAKPRTGLSHDWEIGASEFIQKIKVLSGVVPIRRRGAARTAPPAFEDKSEPWARPIRVVALGASTGGPPALNTILSGLPRKFPVPILCVQHIGEGFLNGLIAWLARSSGRDTRIAVSGEVPQAGVVYFPQENRHLTLDSDGRLDCSAELSVCGHRPSVTVTFKSIAKRYGSACAGALLTGMGDDGAEGLKAMADAGGYTIAQDERTSVVFGMPERAIALGAVRVALPIDRIASALTTEIANRQRRAARSL